ncbi:hypothetical protein [Fictibacillus barbaricus]|uniref:Type 4 fimbrial biogenesis protein PilX N-terminal domain-containing protein n=1 Tax=Fictibacillus barbaricus TaxID=182136 RepID=A0ABU1U116_9BACL|nr:hypothetical protein [Fictibacillus barbaricus]MDR7073147.1 hypothetical protein [Fictibacillus barbaricus]
MKKILSERGNTLLIVLLMIVIFTVAGLSLVTTTFNGVKKTDARETQIQSTELAEKGIDYLSALLEAKSKNYINYSTNDFETALTNLLSKYEVSDANAAFKSTSSLPADGGVLKVKIYNRHKTSTNPDDLTQVMTLHSEATVNGKTKKLISTIQLGAKQVPEALNYALGAYNPCKGQTGCTSKNDDGNMFMHGGVAVKGDLYVEGNLITKKEGVAIEQSGTPQWISSDLPSIEGENGKKARLILPGNLYKLTSNPEDYYAHINRTTFPSANGYQNINKNNVDSAFTSIHEANKEYVPMIDNRIPKFAAIDILGQKNSYYFPITGNSFVTNEVNDGNFNNNPNKENIRSRYENDNVQINTNNNIKIDGGFTFNRLSTKDKSENRIISITGSSSEWSKLTFKKGAYLGGNVTIGNTGITSYNTNTYNKFEIDGPLFIDGNLTIWGSNIKFNSTIYVTGTTTIRYSRLQGIVDADNVEKSLVLFGKKQIAISNNNVYGDDPNIIRGFFYSEDLMEIFGVGSNLEIQGGVFGRKVVLNATRGSVYNSGWPYYRDVYALNQTQLSPSKSRLKITYNPELIQNPPEGLPKVTDLSVTTLDRYLQ